MARETDTRKHKGFRVEESLHNALIEMMNITGKSMEDLLANGASMLVMDFAKKGKGKNILAYEAQVKMRERQTQETILKQVAVAYQANPSEEALDEFQKLCDGLGKSMEKVIEDMNEMPHIAEVLKGTNSISNAQMWILNNLKPDKPMASTAIETMGDKAGYKIHTLRDARERLNLEGTVKIDSIKQGTMWFWRMTVLQ